SGLARCSVDDPRIEAEEVPEVPHAHLGVHPQKQDGLFYIGLSTPVGLVESDMAEAIANISEEFGNGELRLTIFENVLIPNIPREKLEAAKLALETAGISFGSSNLRGGLVACTGNRYCKFSAADTKGHGVALTQFLDSRVELDQPINIHVTGCPHSCAQHYIGDIGLLGCKVEGGNGEPLEGFHLFVGGGFGHRKNFGRQLFKSLVAGEELQAHVLALLQAYKAGSLGGQGFQEWVLGQADEEIVSMVKERL
ncbi:MAG: NirA family protein, partial [Verrucomicrobiales bacterium]